jgi:tetratricopeptide (TPR) repeat protein
MVKALSWISFASLLLVVPAAHAASRESKERAAKRACLNGDYAKGVQLLTDLFIDTNDATYLFNQGRCYEQSNRYEAAIGRFREYLRKIGRETDADKADAVSAEKHIADCEKLLGHKVAEPDAPQPQPPPAEPSPPPPAPPPQPQIPVVVTAPPPPASAGPDGGGLRVAGIATGVVGVAALAAGVVLNLKANSMVNDVQNRYDGGTLSSSKDYKTMSVVGYGAGAACLAGGVLLYYLGVRAGSQVTVAPAVAEGTAGALLTGGF